MKKIRIVELFAGVGGFRLGLDAASRKDCKYEVVWSSQWEPDAKMQHASGIYVHKFGSKGHSCEDIRQVVEKKFEEIVDHDLLVGGFPCQDYSVARTLSRAEGLKGKKGVLWWSIFDILKKKGKKAPRFLMLENVDRLLKSPASQRGRDFAVMLSSLADLGYAVEWRIINAAEYGFPQRRRRVFILGYKKGTNLYTTVNSEKMKSDWLQSNGVIAKAFPVEKSTNSAREFLIEGDFAEVTKNFSVGGPAKSPFENSGLMINRKVYTLKTIPKQSKHKIILGDIIETDEKKIPDVFFVDDNEIKEWEYLKAGKKERRETKTGHVYHYSEGSMIFPDSLEKPSRTIVTGEGGRSASRFKHVIRTNSGRLRRLMPIELERLNMFPDNHTRFMGEGLEVSDVKRAFIMGNALVVGVIRELGKSLRKAIEKE
ncbi:MAG: DNA (cytosine-5-)-methyltransferase [Candidatus Moraniibacteriota bacterium]|nr:MAG: DNA (cytosine-5-)-methyltransferase [Candidatus Moranbacteria bacterium]